MLRTLIFLFVLGVVAAGSHSAPIIPYYEGYKQQNEAAQTRAVRVDAGPNSRTLGRSFSAHLDLAGSECYPGGEVVVVVEARDAANPLVSVQARVLSGGGMVVEAALLVVGGKVRFRPPAAGTYIVELSATSQGDAKDGAQVDVASVVAVVVERVLGERVGSVRAARHPAHPDAELLLALGVSLEGAQVGDRFAVTAHIAYGNAEVAVEAFANLDANLELVVGVRLGWLAGAPAGSLLRLVRAEVACGRTRALQASIRGASVGFEWGDRVAPRGGFEPASEEAVMGVRPGGLSGSTRDLLSATHRTILLPGYCSKNQWNLAAFGDQGLAMDTVDDRNLPTATYAAEVVAFLDARGYSYASGRSCSLAGHSHGGVAALATYATHWTCLDNNAGSQFRTASLGAPMYGTPLAGNLAALGAIFGAGCGANYDLSYMGATAWAGGVPGWARSSHLAVTTAFEDKWRRYDYCHLASDLLLSDPDDGAVERSRAFFSSHPSNHATYSGLCHIEGMRDPFQVTAAAVEQRIAGALAA
jgi:hypothetical protein